MTDLCWKPDRVHEVINIDADFVPDAVFWAVDHDAPLTFKSTEGEAGSKITTDEMVARFLDPSRNHYQLAVLGPAGTGKSHLIHRMRQRIEDRPGFEILAVRRLETNLHAILEKLIAQLPVDQQGHYRAELDKAGPTLSTPAVQKGTLLDSLSQAIEEDVRRPDSGIDQELEEALLTSLPNMFRDPYIRQAKFLAPGEVVPELVDRLFSRKEGKRLEERVLFERANLPLSGIDLPSCSVQAREAIEIFLYDSDHYVPATLSVINRCVDRAISRALNFSGDQLGRLLGEIRAYLKTRDKELVILFEEFARLQGYDSAMLEALLVQGDETYCNVRWALACTTGRFREFPDTVRTRMAGVVDMESSPLEQGVKEFAGRYLNAVRIGRDGLIEALTEKREGGIPNACENCPKRDACTTAFGVTEEGYSLYPFTAAALNTMAGAVNPDFSTRFNPREFQKGVLRPVLVDEAVALETDEFPTLSLASRFGLPPLGGEVRERLREKAGARFERYRVLFQLWSEGRLENPPEGVMRAFGLKPLSGLDRGSSVRPEVVPDLEQPAQAQPKRDPDSDKLAAWIEGGPLDQTLAQRIRRTLFPLIERAIDWDTIGLVPSKFASPTGGRPFRNSSIAFLGQTTTGGAMPTIRLELPLQRGEADFDRAAIAFETLLKIEKAGDWVSGGRLDHLAHLSELVDACAAEVVRQLEGLRGSPKKWDPISGAVELLLVGSALGGAMSPTQSQTDEGLIEALYKGIPQDSPQTMRDLQKLYASLVRKRDELQDLLRAHASATKGGRLGRFINPVAPLAAARLFRRRNWQLKRQPEELSDPYRFVGELYKEVKDRLHPTLMEEQCERSHWLNEVESNLGSNPDRPGVLQAVNQTLDAAAKGGLPGHRVSLESARDSFAGVQFVAAVEAARRISEATSPEAALPYFARAHRNAVEATRVLIRRWSDYLAVVEEEVKTQRADEASREIERETQRLQQALSALIDELSDLELRETLAEPL